MSDITNIKEFETRFVKLFENEVAPKIKQFDIEREKTKENVKRVSVIIYIILGIISFIYAVYSVIHHSVNTDIITYLVCFFFIPQGYAYFVKKRFELKLKERVMPILMCAFGNFRWVKEEIISFHEVSQAKMFKLSSDYSKSDDDCFVGSYKDMNIKISESALRSQDKNETDYEGVFILLEIPKRFTGHTVVTVPKYKKVVPYNEVKLEDVEFGKQFYVGSTDQVEARYLLTTAFMQRFKNIQNAFGGEYITCSFLNNSLLMFVPITDGKDLFSIGNLDESVADPKQFGIMLKEIISIFELIEELKLYQNTGL